MERLEPRIAQITNELLDAMDGRDEVDLIGSGAYLLLTHPEQRDRLVADPGLLPNAVEYAGVTIPAGEPVLISLLSANHDESVFTDADRFDGARFDGARRDAGHLTFGHGIHLCLSAALAWRPGLLIRGLVEFPVRLR